MDSTASDSSKPRSFTGRGGGGLGDGVGQVILRGLRLPPAFIHAGAIGNTRLQGHVRSNTDGRTIYSEAEYARQPPFHLSQTQMHGTARLLEFFTVHKVKAL